MRIINGDNIKVLKEYPDNYFDAVVTDPPYGLGKEPNAAELMKDWIEHGYHEIKGSGFMGKEWDAFVPQPIFWKEVFRVLKHGGHVLAFYGTRTYDWGVMSMRFAGFEVRDCIQWLYGSGFPKSLSISKSIDKQNKNKWENISKSIDNISKVRILDIWKEKSSNAIIVDSILKKNQIEIGTPTQKKDFVQESVILKINQEKEIANVIIAELISQEVLHYVEENQHIAQENVEANIEQLQIHAKYVVKLLQDLNHLYLNIFSARLNVKELEKEKTIFNHKVEEALMIWHGNQKSLKEEDMYVLCVEVINDLKHIILNQSKTFLNYDIIQKTECVSAINVIITEYMVVNLISNMVSIVKSKALDKMGGAEREVIGINKSGKGTDSGSGTYNMNNGNSTMKKEFDITAPATDAAKQWEGWGTALKPANEPIVLARKPLEKGLSIAENILKWGVGGINIDASRIGKKEGDRTEYGVNGVTRKNNNNVFGKQYGEIQFDGTQGRFPANLVLTHHPECVCKGTKKVKGMIDKPTNRTEKGNTWNDDNIGLRKNMSKNSGGFADADGMEEIEDWDCVEDCPIRILDEQSGITKSGKVKEDKSSYNGHSNTSFLRGNSNSQNQHGDKGGASRFFYCAKASKSERNKGLDDFEEKESGGMRGTIDKTLLTGSGNERNNMSKNFHPTVKPIKLMQYLIRMVTPPNGIVLDPFVGSGTTGIACKLEGFNFVGMEQDPEYAKIAEGRINNFVPENEDLPEQKSNELTQG